jgi:hypothetical protein
VFPITESICRLDSSIQSRGAARNGLACTRVPLSKARSRIFPLPRSLPCQPPRRCPRRPAPPLLLALAPLLLLAAPAAAGGAVGPFISSDGYLGSATFLDNRPGGNDTLVSGDYAYSPVLTPECTITFVDAVSGYELWSPGVPAPLPTPDFCTFEIAPTGQLAIKDPWGELLWENGIDDYPAG